MVLFRLFQRGFNGMLSGAAFYIMILFAGGRNIHRIPLWRRFLCAGGVLRFAPVAVIFGALVAGFHRLIGAHTHIVFFAVFKSGNGFFGGAVFAHRDRLCVFKVRRCTVLDLIPGGLGFLLFPSYGNFLFPASHFADRCALWLDGKVHGARALILTLQLHLYAVAPNSLAPFRIIHRVISTCF